MLLHDKKCDLQEVQIQLQKQKKLQTSWRTVSFQDQWDPPVRVGPGHEKHSICLVSETKKSFQIILKSQFLYRYVVTTEHVYTGQILVLIFTKCSNMIFRKIHQLFWLLFENAFFSWLFSRWGFTGHDSLVIYVVLSMADTLPAPSVVAKQHTRVHPMMNGFVWRTIFKFALMAVLGYWTKG